MTDLLKIHPVPMLISFLAISISIRTLTGPENITYKIMVLLFGVFIFLAATFFEFIRLEKEGGIDDFH